MFNVFKNKEEYDNFMNALQNGVNHTDFNVDEGLENLDTRTKATDAECKKEILHRFDIIANYNSGLTYYKNKFEQNNSLICFVADDNFSFSGVNIRDNRCESVAGFSRNKILAKVENAETKFDFKVYMCILQKQDGTYTLIMFYVDRFKCDWRRERCDLANRTPYVYVENLENPFFSEGGSIIYDVAGEGVFRVYSHSGEYDKQIAIIVPFYDKFLADNLLSDKAKSDEKFRDELLEKAFRATSLVYEEEKDWLLSQNAIKYFEHIHSYVLINPKYYNHRFGVVTNDSCLADNDSNRTSFPDTEVYPLVIS